jgi:hypothetical protein
MPFGTPGQSRVDRLSIPEGWTGQADLVNKLSKKNEAETAIKKMNPWELTPAVQIP